MTATKTALFERISRLGAPLCLMTAQDEGRLHFPFAHQQAYRADEDTALGIKAFMDAYPALYRHEKAVDACLLVSNKSNLPFELMSALNFTQALYDIKALSDYKPDRLKDYPLLVLSSPGKRDEDFSMALVNYVNQGGRVLIFGDFSADDTALLAPNGNPRFIVSPETGDKEVDIARFSAALRQLLKPIRTIKLSSPFVGVQQFMNSDSVSIHLFNPDKTLNKSPQKGLVIQTRLTGQAMLHLPLREHCVMDIRPGTEGLELYLQQPPLYAVIEIKNKP